MFFSRLLLVLICLVGFASGQALLPADEGDSEFREKGLEFQCGSMQRVISRAGPSSQRPARFSKMGPLTTFAALTLATARSAKVRKMKVTTQNGKEKRVLILKAQNLNGSVPRELVRLPFLREIDLTRNYLKGTIPPEWGSMNLVNISLIGNRVTGSIPVELANITTLANLTLEYNQLSGTIPPEFGDLPRLERLIIQASGLTGPIPAGIASLTRLTDLRISDLNGNDLTFPPLSNIRRLKTLDLSFNKLSGPIPDSFIGLSNTDYIYLTGNLLSGPLPAWMLTDGDRIDLSYNNLTSENSAPNCQPRDLGIVSCLRSFHCEKKRSSLHINCGGGQVVDDKGIIYEEDANSGGPSNFFPSKTNWGFSSTGHFLDDDRPRDSFIWTNSSSISGQNSPLYMDARLSPLSLTYYAFCLMNGNYTVNLHFAEIIFTNDRTFSSLGRRLFDVYIQGKWVLEDFNIESEAGGVNKAIRRNFTAVVTDNTLDIRFYWAGKGTNGIPFRGVYGPLISAISVDPGKLQIMSGIPDFTPPSENGNSISVGAIVGIVMAVLFTFLLVLGILWRMGCLGRKDTMHNDLKGLDLHTGSFTLRQIKAATNNFDPANKIGEGSSIRWYHNCCEATFFQIEQGNREFVNEIGMISALQHPHLVKLYGCCIEGNQLLLVYEYMENNSLARALFGPEEHQLQLDWPTRHKICIGIARGLAYLHEESRLKIVHRDIKATNVLLDENLVPKISDFGLAKLDEDDNTHISTSVAGTFGYMAPEYAMRGYLTDKADVYSFGVVVLEVVSGRSNTSVKHREDAFYLLDWANFLKEEGKLMELVDPRLESNLNKEEVITAINVALHCTNAVAAERPSMSAVVSILEGKAGVGEFVSESNVSIDKMKMEHDVQGQSISMDVPWTASSASTADLYPITLDTDYWEKRDQ
ncbi:hypothetical protein DH2020_011327 [Rehmannia glutinosa]|uniref:non-specific serine/threonine protein kinase n=1 Tax=Rehmannia glutinosa TaxID=99300 RepID=A0ABR0XD49_REHGL